MNFSSYFVIHSPPVNQHETEFQYTNRFRYEIGLNKGNSSISCSKNINHVREKKNTGYKLKPRKTYKLLNENNGIIETETRSRFTIIFIIKIIECHLNPFAFLI